AKNGLASFSMRQITDECGINESLMYRYFETRENLLKKCYEELYHKIIAVHKEVDIEKLQNGEIIEAFYKMYIEMIDLLISEDYRTLFYYEYCEYLNIKTEHDVFEKNTVLKDIMNELKVVVPSTITDEEGRILIYYLIDMTSCFAKRIIRKNLPNNDETKEYIWRILQAGITNLMK
uniref:TetR/AcrR family transcriptional regulator n=1 Tax=uncultured Sharpea sp. TaxID=1112738 RepID=UPI0025860C4E